MGSLGEDIQLLEATSPPPPPPKALHQGPRDSGLKFEIPAIAMFAEEKQKTTRAFQSEVPSNVEPCGEHRVLKCAGDEGGGALCSRRKEQTG